MKKLVFVLPFLMLSVAPASALPVVPSVQAETEVSSDVVEVKAAGRKAKRSARRGNRQAKRKERRVQRQANRQERRQARKAGRQENREARKAARKERRVAKKTSGLTSVAGN
ncbi:MAG: hypothetical protein AAFO98_15260 [Pseudomonadota bacterium]